MDELNEDQNKVQNEAQRPSSEYYTAPMNGELIAGIILLGISFFFFLFSIFLINHYFIIQFVMLGVGIICFALGLYKRNKIKNNNLDF